MESVSGRTGHGLQCARHVRGNELYMQQISESGFMTDLLMITTIICAVAALLWYRFGIVKKYTRQQKQDFKELINGRNIATVVVTAIGCYGIALLLSRSSVRWFRVPWKHIRN